MDATGHDVSSGTITPTPPQRGMVRIAPLGAIPEVLRGFRVEPGSLLQRYGLSEEALFRDPEETVPLAAVGRLLTECAQATACPHFGLLVGQRVDASALGAVGLFLGNAPDVKTALEGLVANLDLHDRGAAASLDASAGRCTLGYEVYESGIEGTDQIGDAAVAICCNIMRALCGPDWSPTEVRLRHGHPVEVEPYRRFFLAPLRFNAEHNCLLFSSHWLSEPIVLADPDLRQHFMDRIQALRANSNQSFRDQAHKALVTLIGSQLGSREQLAIHFSIHPRTLNRRLRGAGTSFRELYNEVRHEIARQLLRDTRRSIPAIASLLKYSDATAFSRAFSRWQGISPAKWRKRVRSEVTRADPRLPASE
jgi:AraC-like DNA-binding protein